MIRADLHTHTAYAHGKNSVREMFEAGQRRGLLVHGFSEHSPRPRGYDYPVEYRERLAAGFPSYVDEVRELADEQRRGGTGVAVLLGMEQDWLEDEPAAMIEIAGSWPFDYIIGGIHFLGAWGFDASAADWEGRTADELAGLYARYYRTMRRMAESGLFRIVAHPDLIKIFTVDAFHAWLGEPDSLDLVRDALVAARDAGMAMEISSAGLRKPCREIYPGPIILNLAADLGVPISFGSDGHCVDTIGADFDRLAHYAAGAGYRESLVFQGDSVRRVPFRPVSPGASLS